MEFNEDVTMVVGTFMKACRQLGLLSEQEYEQIVSKVIRQQLGL